MRAIISSMNPEYEPLKKKTIELITGETTSVQYFHDLHNHKYVTPWIPLLRSFIIDNAKAPEWSQKYNLVGP